MNNKACIRTASRLRVVSLVSVKLRNGDDVDTLHSKCPALPKGFSQMLAYLKSLSALTANIQLRFISTEVQSNEMHMIE